MPEDEQGDAHAAKSRPISPARRHKVALIKAAMGKSDRAVHTYLFLIHGYAQSLAKFGSDPKYATGVSPTEIANLAKLRAELLHARDRVDALHTGLRAEREISHALTEFAAAFDQWHRAMSSSDTATISHAQDAMERHFDNAHRFGKAGTADLKRGV